MTGEKKSKRNIIIGIIVVLLVIGAIGSCTGNGNSSFNSSSTASNSSANEQSESSNVTNELSESRNATSEQSESSNTASEAEKELAPEEEPVKAVPDTPQAQIESVIRSRIDEKFTMTNVDSITINEDLGTDMPDDYIALVNLTWTQKNSGKTSKDMLSLYSEDLAATVGNECPNVQEIAIFWDVPYLNDNAKCSYERKGAGMYEMDMVWGSTFNG